MMFIMSTIGFVVLILLGLFIIIFIAQGGIAYWVIYRRLYWTQLLLAIPFAAGIIMLWYAFTHSPFTIMMNSF